MNEGIWTFDLSGDLNKSVSNVYYRHLPKEYLDSRDNWEFKIDSIGKRKNLSLRLSIRTSKTKKNIQFDYLVLV